MTKLDPTMAAALSVVAAFALFDWLAGTWPGSFGDAMNMKLAFIGIFVVRRIWE